MGTEQGIPVNAPIVGQGPTKDEVQFMMNRLQRMAPTNVIPLGPGSFWPGLSTHDFFAAHIMAALLGGKNALAYGEHDCLRIAKKAYDITSALMAVREDYYNALRSHWTVQDEEAKKKMEAERKAQAPEPVEEEEERSPRHKAVYK